MYSETWLQPLKNRQNWSKKPCGSLMHLKSTAECSTGEFCGRMLHRRILQYFWPASSNYRSWKPIFSSPDPKAQGDLIVWDSSRRLSICPSVLASTLSKMNISETSWPIAIKFYLEHHWGGGLTALGFGSDRIRTLVSMATDSSHRVIMGKTLWPL